MIFLAINPKLDYYEVYTYDDRGGNPHYIDSVDTHELMIRYPAIQILNVELPPLIIDS